MITSSRRPLKNCCRRPDGRDKKRTQIIKIFRRDDDRTKREDSTENLKLLCVAWSPATGSYRLASIDTEKRGGVKDEGKVKTGKGTEDKKKEGPRAKNAKGKSE